MPGQASLMSDMPLPLQQDVAYEEMKEIIQDVCNLTLWTRCCGSILSINYYLKSSISRNI